MPLIIYTTILYLTPSLCFIVLFSIGVLWVVDWLTWVFGEEDIDVNHFRRMK